MKILEAEHLCKSFGQTKVLKDISFSLEESQVLSIIGSSGSGKTTLLRCLNFLEHPDKGIIRVKDKTVFDAANPVTMQDAEIRKNRLHFGLVFQSFNLFPQYTALKNVMLAKELLAKERPDYKARKKELHDEIEAQAVSLLNRWDFPNGSTTTRTNSPVDSVNVLQSPVRLPCNLIFSVLMSQLLPWIRN